MLPSDSSLPVDFTHPVILAIVLRFLFIYFAFIHKTQHTFPFFFYLVMHLCTLNHAHVSHLTILRCQTTSLQSLLDLLLPLQLTKTPSFTEKCLKGLLIPIFISLGQGCPHLFSLRATYKMSKSK